MDGLQTSTDSRAPRFLIVRLSHIGDAILTLPLAARLREQFPQSHIAWAAEPAAAHIVRLCPAVDEVVVVRKGWLKQVAGWRALRRQLQSLRADVSLDPQSLLKSSALARLSGAPCRIGFKGLYGKEGSTWLNNCLVEPRSLHLVDRTLELLSPLGIAPPEVPVFNLPTAGLATDRLNAFLESLNSAPFATLNPGAGWASKQWVPERFGVVAHQLKSKHGITPVVTWAGEEERAMAERIRFASERTAVVAPSTTLPELAALLSRSRFFIGCDTAPLHLATAVGTPCIGLYGPTLPAESGAYGRQHIAVQKWHQNGKNRKRESNLAMMDICVEDVCRAVESMLQKMAPERMAS